MRKLNLPSLPTREAAAIGALWVLLAGLLCSRALLSIGMILFGAVALWGISPRRWINAGLHLSLGWVGLYAISALWSTDKALWMEHLQVKLPVLLLPAAFAALPAFSSRARTVLLLGLSAILIAGVAYSLSFLLRAPADVIAGYGMSHALRTPVYGNHISFSAILATTIVLLGAAWKDFDSRAARWIAGVCVAAFVLYLHVLAAKTGLVMLYLAAVFSFVRLLRKRRWGMALTAACIAIGIVAAAAKWVPTFSRKIDYVKYSVAEVQRGAASGAYSDVGRVLSYRVALGVIAAQPLLGVGAGDMESVMSEGYRQRYPEQPAETHLLPHNQFICVSLAAGIPTLLLFCAWLAYPLRRLRLTSAPRRHRYWLAALWIMALVPLMVEPFLEVQSGVAVHLLSCFLQWHACAADLPRRRATDVSE